MAFVELQVHCLTVLLRWAQVGVCSAATKLQLRYGALAECTPYAFTFCTCTSEAQRASKLKFKPVID